MDIRPCFRCSVQALACILTGLRALTSGVELVWCFGASDLCLAEQPSAISSRSQRLT